MANLLISLIFAAWVVTIAVLSVQNATPVALTFLFFKSIEIPVGVVLAVSAGAGMAGTAALLPLWGLVGAGRQLEADDEDEDEEEEEELGDESIADDW